MSVSYTHLRLTGREIGSFRGPAEELDALPGPDGKRLHTALRYGLSQALLHAASLKGKKLMCEVLAEEYGLPIILEPVPIFSQSGDERFTLSLIHISRQVISMLEAQKLLQTEELKEEEAVIEREVGEIISRVRELGEGDLALGTVLSLIHI